MISQHNAARKSKVNDVDQLTLFKENFPENSTRRKMYETKFKVAMDEGRIPSEAGKVLQEMIDMFKKWHCDSEIQIRARHNAAFHNLTMTKNNHFKFRAEFEALVVDMERAGVHMSALQLRDEYLMKLDQGLREHVLQFDLIRGESPETWQRVAETVEMIQRNRLDIPNHHQERLRSAGEKKEGKGPPADNLSSLKGGNVAKCSDCGGHGHNKGTCANHITRKEGKYESIKAQQEASKKYC